MKVKTLTEESTQRFDHYVLGSPSATLFHLTHWKRAVEKSFGHQAFYLYAEKNGTIKGVLPLFYVKSLLFGRSLVSVPFGVYGGIVADDQETEGILVEAAKELVGKLRGRYLELRHVNNNGIHLPTKDFYVTFQREIYSDVGQNMAAIPRKQRRMIRQGIKHGLRSLIGSDYLQEFYEIYARSVKNLGTPVFPYRFFENLQNELDKNCKLLTVWHGKKMVAGVMTFFFQDRVMPYYGGSLHEYFSYAVNDFMYWEAFSGIQHRILGL